MTPELTTLPIKDRVVTLVREINHNQEPDTLWEKTVAIAKEYQVQGTENNLPEMEEIIGFGEEVLATPKKDRYKLSLKTSSSGKLWYDILMGDDNQNEFSLVKDFLEKEFKKTNIKYNFAADLGSGTGNTIRSIAPFCRKVRGIDSSEAAIKVANEIGLPENSKIILANAQRLVFTDESLNLIVSNGLTYYLSETQVISLIDEIYRVLKHGGKFYQAFHLPYQGELVPRSCRNPLIGGKSTLIHLMEKMVSDGGNPDSLNVLTSFYVKNF
jgi:SAM-dependent methyltransferase